MLLALDCSSSRRSVALARHGTIAGELSQSAPGSSVLAMADELFSLAGVGRDAIQTLVVGLGPGSYTGIRAAIAVAQGWHLATRVRLLGISSADACAVRARHLGHRGRTAVVIDAQRGEFYCAEFDLLHDRCMPLRPIRLVSRDEIHALAREGVLIAGPDVASFGARARAIFPEASALALIAMDHLDSAASESAPCGAATVAHLEPIYLRPVSFTRATPPPAPPAAPA